MTPTSYMPAMRAATDLVKMAEAAGILVRPAVYPTVVSLSAIDSSETGQLATLLGLTERRVYTFDDGAPIEVWTGMVDGMTVTTQRTMKHLSVFDAARAAGHDEPCATRQHMRMVSECTCTTKQVAS